ncbi:phospholipase D-like domain-containing protein [Nannocystis sp. ILAH1]|uniref:phospholipase D family protein n=1 Tax=Nannocystis sp. ILAH1 TaxID=2996789 RepID=UPI0022710804|nr:phospholipase D-like domain-containing protein [Nannocystis sp. ILAH1]MCY0989457.1 phospholipase D-like domain-containing protein [Nannocystis sp. ILAH1]
MTRQHSFEFPGHPSSQFDVHATWCRSGNTNALKSLWDPVEGAEHFMLISCFVSQSGWSAIASLLREEAARTPRFQAQLIFSLYGLDRVGGAGLLQNFKDFAERDEHRERIQVFVVEDSQKELFHPKGHASYAGSIERRSRVVVGSANLTRSGMTHHDEMMCVFENEPRIYSQFSRAFEALRKRACPVHGENINRIERKFLSRSSNSSSPSNTTPHAATPDPILNLDPAGPELFVPIPASFERTLESVAALLRQGVQVIRNDRYEDLSVSVSLRRFVSARIIPGLRTTAIADGVSLSRGSGANGLNVHLTPDAMTANLHKLNRDLGRLLGYFSLEVGGLRWMPSEWWKRFTYLWDDCVAFYKVSRDHDDVEGHLTALRSLFTGSSPRTSALKAKLRLSSPGGWDISAAEKLLGTIRESDLQDPDALKNRAFSTILRHCQEDLNRHLNLDFVIAQVSRAGMRPRPDHIDATRLSLAIDALADLAMAGINHAFKTDKADRVTGNAVTSVLAARIKQGVDPRDVYNTAATWKNVLLSEQPEHANRSELLIAAWQCFLRWFRLEPETTEWHLSIPQWRRPSEKKQSDIPDTKRPGMRPKRRPRQQ